MRTWTKRDPVKNYFPLPNEIYQLGLSHGAIAVYGPVGEKLSSIGQILVPRNG